jgi:prophage regulatory protein
MHCSNSLPESGFVRLTVIIGCRKTGQPGVLPLGPTTWWSGVKDGRFPKPVKLGPRITAWRVEDIRELIDKLSQSPCWRDRSSQMPKT